MKNIIGMFLPFFVFLFITIILFIFLKNDNIRNSEPKVKEIFKEVNIKKDIRVKKSAKLSTSEVSHVRWSQHDGFERLVFDIIDYDVNSFKLGEKANDKKKLYGFFTGYRYFSRVLPDFKSSQIVKSMEVYEEGRDGYSFTLFLYRPIKYKVFALLNPDRVVVDMY